MCYTNIIDVVKNNYNKLLITLDDNIDELMAIDISLKNINLNVSLAEKLLEYPIKKRMSRVGDAAQDIINKNDEDIIAINGIEVLFTKHLNVDCIELLKRISRNKVLIVKWPGEYKNDILIYASGHIEEYKYKVNNDFIVIGGSR